MLGDALTKGKAEAADLLRACVRASAHQLADASSTLQRAPEEREAWFSAKADGKIRGHGRRTADENVPGRTHRHGTDGVLNDSNRGSHASEFPSEDRVVQHSVEARESKGDAATSGEHGKHPDHGGCISSPAGRPGERDHVEWMRGELHTNMKNLYSPAIRQFRGQDDLPKREQSSSRLPRVQAIAAVADRATKMLGNFPRERSRVLLVLVTPIRLAFVEQR